jgi:hypothetical protein
VSEGYTIRNVRSDDGEGRGTKLVSTKGRWHGSSFYPPSTMYSTTRQKNGKVHVAYKHLELLLRLNTRVSVYLSNYRLILSLQRDSPTR